VGRTKQQIENVPNDTRILGLHHAEKIYAHFITFKQRWNMMPIKQ